MNEIYCNNCGEPLSSEPEGSSRQPCPICGSTNRKFTQNKNGAMKPSGHVMGAHVRNEQTIGFAEGEQSDLTRCASLEADGRVLLNLRGLAPRNEQDSDEVCAILVAALNTEGLQVTSKGRGEQDEDHILVIDGVQVGVQVVRALTEPQFWKKLAHSGEVRELRLSPSDAASALKLAIEHKTSIPAAQRSQLILVLDAYRLPALAIGPVASQFQKAYGAWAQSLGFRAVYVAGPIEIVVSRLDKANKE
jgi:hypothetical protein